MLECNQISKMFMDRGLVPGRLISMSKSGYSNQYPTHLALYNANVVTEKYGKIWYGDLDLTTEYKKLKELAKEIGETLYVLYEMDARFENEDNPLIGKAVWNTNMKGQPKNER